MQHKHEFPHNFMRCSTSNETAGRLVHRDRDQNTYVTYLYNFCIITVTYKGIEYNLADLSLLDMTSCINAQ